MSASEIVNMAEKVWKIIDDNKPVSKIDSFKANAVPNVSDWTNLENARGPKKIRWYRSMINSLPESWGNIVVDIDLDLHFTYGATYNGGGYYIPNIWFDVNESYTAWFHELELKVECRDPENANTASAPLARIPVILSGKMSSPKASITLQQSFMLYGNGKVETDESW